MLSKKYIWILVLALFQLGNSTFDITEIQEIPLSCDMVNCTECPASHTGIKSCTRCQLGYFLYLIPSEFDKDEGYTAEQYICVECPGYSAATNNSQAYIPCGDCVDDPNTWLNNRKCTYDYTINAEDENSLDPANDVLMKKEKQQIELYFVFYSLVNNVITSVTQHCEGCFKFCGETVEEAGCNLFHRQIIKEELQRAVICQEGYFWNLNTCTKCNQDGFCKKCIRNAEREIQCVVCFDGYALNNLGTCTPCSAIQNCQNCFYGDDSGRNYSENPVEFYKIANLGTISLRCKFCSDVQIHTVNGNQITTIKLDEMMIPTLDLKQCETCDSNCIRCDYSSTINGKEIHTINPRVVKDSEQGDFQKRCRVCQDSKFLNTLGGCEDCDILNCRKCIYGLIGSVNSQDQYYTLNVHNFELDDSDLRVDNSPYVKYCAICQNGYKRNSSGQCEANAIQNCLSQVEDKCIICINGYVADQISGFCVAIADDDPGFLKNCGQYVKQSDSNNQESTYCLSCVKYSGNQGQDESYHGYPSYHAQQCLKCDQTDICSDCTQWNWRFNMIDYLQIARPFFDEETQTVYTDELLIEQSPWCLKCDSPNILNPWTGECLGCLNSCKSCSIKLGTPQCAQCQGQSILKSGLQVKASQNSSKGGCFQCSDYELNCVELPQLEKIERNPYHTHSDRFNGKVRWTKANQCRKIDSDFSQQVPQYTQRFMFYNSFNMKCQVCQTNTGCKKRVRIPYFFDNTISQHIDIEEYFQNNFTPSQSSSFQGYNAYSIAFLQSENRNQLINMRHALEINDAFILFSEEGVEEIVLDIIFVSSYKTGSTTELDPIKINFTLEFLTEAMEMIPTLTDVKVTVTTMLTGDISTIGQKRMALYIQDNISFSQFLTVEFKNIDLYPLQNIDLNQQKLPFFIALKNVLLPTRVYFIDCSISNTNSLDDQLEHYNQKGSGQHFQLIAPSLELLSLQNFQLNNIYYPPNINFFDPITNNIRMTTNIYYAIFKDLHFSQTSIFSLNHTNSSLVFSNLQLININLKESYFIKEKEGLKRSLIRIDMNEIFMKGLIMEDSYIVFMMNAIRFKGSNWKFQGPFEAKTKKTTSSLICTNLLSLDGLIVENDPNDPSQLFHLLKTTMFTTPKYSLLVVEDQQINHRYQNIDIKEIKCDLSTSSSQFSVFVCFFDLQAPYNPENFLLNVKMHHVVIEDIITSSTILQNNWYFMKLQQIEDISMIDFEIYGNYKFQGLHIYNPNTIEINDFECGDRQDTNYQIMKQFNDVLSQFDQSKVHGLCINLKYCQSSLNFSNIILKNYVGYQKSPYIIECNDDVKDEDSSKVAPINIDNFLLTNSVIFISDPNQQVSLIFIKSPYPLEINISRIEALSSLILPIQIRVSSISSSSILLVDSVSSNLKIIDSLIIDTTSSFTQNGMVFIVSNLELHNTLMRNANIDFSNKDIQTNGGFINARANSMIFYDITLENGVANRGSGLFLKTVEPGTIKIIGKSKFQDLKSSTSLLVEGEGAAIYIDCRESQLDLLIDGALFENIFGRTAGGVLLIDSASRESTIVFKNSQILNAYAPMGSIIYAQQINELSSIHLENIIVEWTDQDLIFDYIKNKLAPSGIPDPMLSNSFQDHSQIWISKGTLVTKYLVFTGLKYQHLFKLSHLLKWHDEGSVITDYQLITYPMIDTIYCDIIHFQGTTISNVSHKEFKVDNTIFEKFATHKSQVISFVEDGELTLENCLVQHNTVQTSKGFIFFSEWTKKVDIIGSTFNFNKGIYGVLYFYHVLVDDARMRILSQVPQAYIKNSIFSFNQAEKGSAITAYSSFLNLFDTTFSNNYSSEEGGALYSYQENGSKIQVVFSGVTFNNNFGGIGGAYSIHGISPQFILTSPSVFNQNSASLYGSSKAEQAISLRIIFNGKIFSYQQGDSTPIIKNFAGGQNPGNLLVQLIGSDGKIIRNQKEATCMVSLNYQINEEMDESVKIVGNPIAQFNEIVGGFNFTNLILIGQPPSIIKIKFSSSSVSIPIVNNLGSITGYDGSYYFPLELHTRACTYGEIYDEMSGQCYACPKHKYSVQLGATQCLSCPKKGVDDCPGYDQIVVSAGYWRKNNLSDVIVECQNQQSNCIGGRGNQLCFQGHIGALCEECDITGEVWGESYALSASYTCGKCSQVSGNIQKVVIITIWTLLSTLLSVKATILQVQEFIMVSILIKAKIILGGKSSNSKNQSGVLLKILTSYFQVISVLFTFKLTIPSFFTETTDAIGNPSQQMSVSMDCFFRSMSSIHVVYFRLIWQLINPAMYVFVAIIAYSIGVAIKKVRKNIGYIWCTPSVISAFIATSSCRMIGDVQYIKANVSLTCYGDEHMFKLITLIIPSLLTWAVIIPLLFFLKLFKYRNQIYSNIWIRYKFGYLYMEYHRRAYFWEFVKMFQKIALTIVVNIYDDDTKVKAVLCFLIVVIYLILSYIFKPYIENDQNRLDQRANEACAISMIMGVFIYENTYQYLIFIGYSVLVLINLIFVFDIIRCLVRGYTKKLDEIIVKQQERLIKILSKFPSIVKFIKKKNSAYVPLERTTFLWKRTSRHIHKWFKIKQTDKEIKLDEISYVEEKKQDYVKNKNQLIVEDLDQNYESNLLVKRRSQEGDQSDAKTFDSPILISEKIKSLLMQNNILDTKQMFINKKQFEQEDDFQLSNQQLAQVQSIPADLDGLHRIKTPHRPSFSSLLKSRFSEQQINKSNNQSENNIDNINNS